MLVNSTRATAHRVLAGLPRASTDSLTQLSSALARVALSNASISAQRQSSRLFRLSPPTALARRAYATGGSASKSTGAAKSKATTKKAAPKKKKPAVKAKRPRKKVLTDEQKGKAEIRDLKKAALSEPKGLPDTAWTVLVAEMSKSAHGLQGKEASARYKTFSPEDREHYNHIANENKSVNEAAYKQWVESHTPDQIKSANNARHLLKRRLKVAHGYPQIKDERQPKRIVGAYAQFFKERLDSGDLKHMEFKDKAQLVSSEWKGLTEGERKHYYDLQKADQARYQKEFKDVFHRDAPGSRSPSA